MLSSESTIDDWELRYSLRSVVQNYQALERVWVIGHRPEWLQGISHIEHPDCYRSNKDANLIAKIIRVAMEPTLSEKFIMMSDDHFILHPTADSDFLPFYNKDMSNMSVNDFANNKWAQRLRRTKEILEKKGMPSRDYEGHVPYVLEKSKVSTYLQFDYGFDIGYCVFSLYFNSVDTQNPIQIDQGDTRAGYYGKPPEKKKFKREIKVKRFLNFNNNSFCSMIKKAVEKKFPVPCRYEKACSQD